MRIITIDKLPNNLHHQVVIKSGERTLHQRMARALERTLNRCSEIHADYELQAERLRKNSEREGFMVGFKLFFAEIVKLLEEHQNLQQQRDAQFRQHMMDALRASLHDSVVVERIIHCMQAHNYHQKAIRIIIPAGIKLSDNADAPNVEYTENNHITVQNETDALRFPGEALCCQWRQHAEQNIVPADTVINRLTPDLLRDIAGQLIVISNEFPETNSGAEHKEHQ